MKRNVASCWLATVLAVASPLRGLAVPPAFSAEARPAPADPLAASPDYFLQKVHPLLEAKCFGCHGEPKDREAEFDMRTRQGLLKGGESGQTALVPGDPDQSRMFQAVLRRGKLKMPPKDRNQLSPEEIEALRQWIAAGAAWTEPKGGKPKWEYKPEDIWAFQPLRKQEIGDRRQETGNRKQETGDPPPLGTTARQARRKENWEKNAMDAFIGAKLREKGLQ